MTLLALPNMGGPKNGAWSTCHTRGEIRVRWRKREDELEECVQFVPGYNCPEPGGQGHGVHGMEVRWFLRGPDGAVVLMMTTGFIPGERWPGHGLSPGGLHDWTRDPDGFGLQYHSRAPRYEGHDAEDGCDLIGGPCYCENSLSGADDPVKRFVGEGEEVIWDALETAYASLATETLAP
jgi:hypothetical protein